MLERTWTDAENIPIEPVRVMPDRDKCILLSTQIQIYAMREASHVYGLFPLIFLLHNKNQKDESS